MKIALIGYGKMGREIEKIALERRHEIPLIVDIDNASDLNAANLKKVDVAIDFSMPQSAFDNVMKCFEAGTPIVSGTTGWADKLEKAKKLCMEKNYTLFWSSNYSLGVNVFFKLNETLAKMMNGLNDYSVSISETHHIHKLDAPSGTAISLANGIIKNNNMVNSWTLLPKVKEKSIPIEAIRKDEVPGIHTIKYESDVDYIEMIHSAKSRKGLALGSVIAAEFIKDKKGFFSMDDLLEILFK
jgi:4-hydroxy-tetrahydrodipicolinate reductase